MGAILVKNADRMMTSVNPLKQGIEIVFADGYKGLIPFADLPEINELSNLVHIELPNPYEIVMRNMRGEIVEIPWDFARHYCDSNYRPRVEAVASSGRQILSARIRRLREAAGLTQEALAQAASISRVTLVRIENGGYSPRFETLVAIAQALEKSVDQLLVGEEAN